MKLVSSSIQSFLNENQPLDSSCYETDFYEKQLKIERSHFWFLFRNRVILRGVRLIEKGLSAPVRMLEIGCGAGNVISFLSEQGFSVEGADLYLDGLQVCERRTRTNLYQFDVRAIPFREKWNVIGCFDVIEHMEEDELALQNMREALEPGGYLILTVPAVEMLYSAKEGTHKRRYSKQGLVSKLDRAGFTIEKISYFFFLLFPIFFAIRLIKKWKQEEVFQSEDFSLHPFINQLLFKICMFESFISKFVSFPIGSSLWCVARKK